MAAGKRPLAPIITLFILSIFLIIIGAALTISIIFILIGLPVLLIGFILLLISIMQFVFGTLGTIGDIFSRLYSLVRRKEREKPKKQKIIDVEEKIYK